MPFYPKLPTRGQYQSTVDVFGGYDHRPKISDGEFYDMKNLTGEFFPLLSTRQKRTYCAALTSPKGLIAKAKLAYIDGTSLYYDGVNVTNCLTVAGVAIGSDNNKRQMVSMGAYIVIFPDKIYFNTEDFEDCGSLDAQFTRTASYSSKLYFYLCRQDGSHYPTPTVSDTAPESPTDGDTWYAPSDADGMTLRNRHVLKQYSADSGAWSTVESVYVKIYGAGIGAKFDILDGVTISGFAGGTILDNDDGGGSCSDSWSMPVFGSDGSGGQTVVERELTQAEMYPDIADLNGEKVIYQRGDDFIVVKGTANPGYSQAGGTITISRTMPDMDFVTEAQNRLWGCKFGLVNGESVNEIYACALGNFKNWRQFQGISTDSYVASVGSDGAWTGAITHLGYPLFFKENCMHKVYISPSGAHQIVDTACRGVQSGSEKSLCVVNETLYYKSRADICAYDGSLPFSVSDALGGERYFNACAGAVGERYFISMEDAENHWHVFVLDTAKGLWHREDDAHALGFASLNGELYFIDGGGALVCVNGGTGTAEELEWEAVSGVFGTDYAGHKYVSRINLRMRLPIGSSADMYFQYDSDGIWHFAGHMDGNGAGSFLLPLRPRRCDHFRFKLCGKGEMKLFSITRLMERGSDI